MLIAAIAIGAFTGATISLVITHGLLRNFMEARGIAPWKVRDSVGSSMLVTVGAALISCAAVLAVLVVIRSPTVAPTTESTLGTTIAISVLALGGSLCLRLGLLALRKLT